MCIEKFVNVLKSFNILKSKSEPSEDTFCDKSKRNSFKLLDFSKHIYYYINPENNNQEKQQDETSKQLAQTKQEQNNNQGKQQDEKILKMHIVNTQNNKTTQINKKNNQANEIISVQQLYKNYPVLQNILLLYNGNIDNNCHYIFNVYTENELNEICDKLLEENKQFYKDYYNTDYYFYIRYFYIAWNKIYDYLLLVSNHCPNYTLQSITQKLYNIVPELETLGIDIPVNFNISVDFVYNNYISAHKRFIEDNIQFLKLMHKSEYIVNWCKFTRSKVPYVIYDICLFNTQIIKPDNNINYIYSIKKLYDSLYNELIRIYLANTNNNQEFVNWYMYYINKLFDSIEQSYIDEMNNKKFPNLHKYFNYLYEQIKIQQKALEDLGLKIDNTLAKAS